jgi:hypothetical protein
MGCVSFGAMAATLSGVGTMRPAVIVVVVVVSSLSARVVTAGFTSLRPYDIDDVELELELELELET